MSGLVGHHMSASGVHDPADLEAVDAPAGIGAVMARGGIAYPAAHPRRLPRTGPGSAGIAPRHPRNSPDLLHRKLASLPAAQNIPKLCILRLVATSPGSSPASQPEARNRTTRVLPNTDNSCASTMRFQKIAVAPIIGYMTVMHMSLSKIRLRNESLPHLACACFCVATFARAAEQQILRSLRRVGCTSFGGTGGYG